MYSSIIKRIAALEKRSETIYPVVNKIDPFVYRETMKDFSEAIERLKQLPHDIWENDLTTEQAEDIISNYDSLVEEDNGLWIERNVVSQEALDLIRCQDRSLQERLEYAEIMARMLFPNFYSHKVAEVYLHTIKLAKRERESLSDNY